MFASLVSARCVLDEIALGFDAAALSPQTAARIVDELGAIRRVVDGMTAKTAKRVAETSTDANDAATSIARTLGVTAGEVRAAIKNATKLETLPATDTAVRQGKLSAREAQMIAGAAIINPSAERELLEKAEGGLAQLNDACIAARAAVEDPAARAKRQHRQRHWRMWTDTEGQLVGRYQYPAEIGGPLKAAIEKQVQRIFRAHKGTTHESNDAYAADAIAEFILGTNAQHPARGADATVHILIDHGTLVRGGTAEGEVCEIPGVGPVDVNWVTQLLGTAFVTAVITRGKDILTVAHLGRHIPAEIMTALIVSGRECDIEGCDHRGYLERDHVHDHAKGGPTSFANLGWLCYRHHRLKSGGWQLGPPHPHTRKRKLRQPPVRAA
jgi:hypothetical protein